MREATEKRRKLWILLLAVICSSFVVANSSVMPVQAAEDTDANTGEVVTSGTFGEYNGEIYTVDKVAKKGYHCISGQYKDTMAIYQDKIYCRKINLSSIVVLTAITGGIIQIIIIDTEFCIRFR